MAVARLKAMEQQISPKRLANDSASSAARRGLHGVRSLTPAARSVFFDLFGEGEATELEMRSALLLRLGEWLAKSGRTPATAARLLGVSRADIMELQRGRLGSLGLAALVRMSVRAGFSVTLQIGWLGRALTPGAGTRLKAVHPGDVLRHEYMEPLELSRYKLAKGLGVTVTSVTEIVRRRGAITAEMALRLSRYFGTTSQLWQNLQSQYELEIAIRNGGKAIERTISPFPRPDLTGFVSREHGDESLIVLSARDPKLMHKLLARPPPPNRRLRAALKRHDELFGHDGWTP